MVTSKNSLRALTTEAPTPWSPPRPYSRCWNRIFRRHEAYKYNLGRRHSGLVKSDRNSAAIVLDLDGIAFMDDDPDVIPVSG